MIGQMQMAVIWKSVRAGEKAEKFDEIESESLANRAVKIMELYDVSV